MKTLKTNNKSNKIKGRQVGNFLVSFDTGNLRSIKITAISGNWNIRFREDNALYTWIGNEMKTEEGREILKVLFAMYYACCNGVPDMIFIEQVFKAYNDSIERLKNSSGSISDEEDKVILDEERKKYTDK